MGKIVKILSRIGDGIFNFISTTFLAGIWSQTGFMLWGKVPWYCALIMWLLYLFPVLIGYYIANKINELNQKVNLRAIAEVPPGAALVDISRKLEKISTDIINNNPKYQKLGIIGILFAIFVLLDIIITILLYAGRII